MAGKEIFIEPILDENLSVIPGLAENIASMTEQLNQTTQIMMDLLGHQGLPQNQAAFTGAALAALTLSGDVTPMYNVKAYGDAPPTSANSITVRTTGKLQRPTFDVDESLSDLTDVTSVSLRYSNVTVANLKLYTDETTVERTLEYSASGRVLTWSIPQECRKKYHKIEFYGNTQGDSGTVNNQFTNITYNGKSGYFQFKEYPHVGFNSNNVLTYIATSTLEKDYTKMETAFLTIPDQASVAEWSTCVLAKSEAIGAAIVDATTHDVLITLPAATNAINQLKEYTNLALMLVFPGDGDASKHLSNFVLRYF